MKKTTIDLLGKSGLDYLTVSIDSIGPLNESEKTIHSNPEVIRLLEYAREQHGIQISFNAVLMKNNVSSVYELIELSKLRKIPMSIGLAVRMPNNEGVDSCDLGFNKNDSLELSNVVNRILSYKENGYFIIEPPEYFRGALKYLSNANVWDCKVTKSKTIQVDPSGKVYWCSKSNKCSDYDAENMGREVYKHFLSELYPMIKECNKNCYSNCAYNSFFYQSNRLRFAKMVFCNYGFRKR